MSVLTAACATSGKGGVLTNDGIDLQDLGSCQESVVDLRLQRAQYQVQLRGRHPEAAFASGQPQPALEQAMRPLVASSIRSTTPGERNFALSCRTWICHVEVYGPDDHTIIRSAPYAERMADWTWGRHKRDVDAATGAIVHVMEEWILLRHPAGEPRTREQLREDARAAEPMPQDLAACHDAAKRLQDHGRRLAAQIEPRPLLEELRTRYDAGTADPQLARLLAVDVARVLNVSADRAAQMTTCRGDVCLLAPLGIEQRESLLDDEAFGSRVDWSMHHLLGPPPRGPGAEALFLMSTRPRANGRKLLEGLLTDAEPGFAKCADLAPKRGALTAIAEIRLAGSGDPPPRIDLSFAGSLRNTARGRCMAEVLSGKVDAVALPPAVSPHKASRDFVYAP